MKMTTEEKERRESRKQHFTTLLRKDLPAGATIYIQVRKRRNGTTLGAKFYYATEQQEIVNITSEVAAVLKSTWNNSDGFMRTNSPTDAVELLGILLHNNQHFFRFKVLD